MKENNRKFVFWQGNEACAEGAIAAGCRFFAGYPITPSTEIAEVLSKRLPEVGGKFIQMEDEIASLGAVLGASAAGVKSMTATSGPGFSLMQEHIGYASMAEVPCVVVNVQRGGPSTGLPTKAHQGDMMQARWGTHGDHPVVAVCPSSVRECFDLTIESFNISEMFRLPVIVMMDEVVGHMREKMLVPEEDEIKIYLRKKPQIPPENYRHYSDETNYLAPFASFGEGYRFIIEGLTHDEYGFASNDPKVIAKKMERLKKKIEDNKDRLEHVILYECENADVIVFAYGCTARSAQQAIIWARKEGLKVGFVKPLVIWPFPEKKLLETIKTSVKAVLVPELNQGQMVLEVERVVAGRVGVFGMERVDGEMITPQEILEKIKEILKGK